MNPPIPPPMMPAPPKSKSGLRTAVVLVLSICLLLIIIFLVVIPTTIGVCMFAGLKSELNSATHVEFTSYTDQFHVTVLELKSQPGTFMERIRINCDKGMEPGIGVNDMAEAGIFATNGASGEIYYREGHPHLIGMSVPVKSEGRPSTCEILFRVSTTSSNTLWHSESTNGSVDTSLAEPLMVRGIQTNWPNTYPRGSDIPLANLGNYKILLYLK